MAEYFPHDYGARTDPKLLRLQSKMGQAGKGIYWDLIEFIYEQGGYLMQSECEGIAFAIHTPFDDMMRVLTEFDLFSFDDGKYYSESVLRRIKVRHDASVKASESAKKRWADAKAMRPHSKGNASAMQEKKSKVKESKENESKVKEESDAVLQPQTCEPPNFLIKLIESDFPRVGKMKNPLTNQQALKILDDFPLDAVVSVLGAMENKAELHRKYLNANLTIRNWIKRELKVNGTDKDKPAFGRLSKATIDRFIPPGTTNPHVEKYLKGDV